jgi:hypothetical protein
VGLWLLLAGLSLLAMLLLPQVEEPAEPLC